MHLTRVFVVLSLFLFLTGCASTIKYSFTNDLYKREMPMDYNVIVDVFEDIRTQDEHDGIFQTNDKFMYTKDKDFKPDVNLQISKAIADHLTESKMFNAVKVEDVDNGLYQDIEAMEILKNRGVDLVITGDIKHFYGFLSGSAGTSVALGVLGVLAEAMANPKTVGANVEYDNIKIIDLNNKQVLWQGGLKHDFREKDTFYDSQVIYALRALKEVNNKFTKKIDNILDEAEYSKR